MTDSGALAVLERQDSDEALVERVRQGDDRAFEELYRRHSRLAVAVARKILRSPQDSEDAAAEAFTNVLSALRRQVGPREMFRAYLLACVRNTCALRIRQRSKQVCSRDRSFADVGVRQDEQVVEGAIATAAFQAIPARWQSALWMAEVEHLDPSVIADRLDLNVPAAAALVYRARQGFTEAYLAQHLRCSGQPSCVVLGPKLAQYVRGTAGTMASRQVESHIADCPACASALSELADVNSSLRSMTAPLSMVTAAGATAAATSGGGATVATGVGFGWLAKAAVVAGLSAAPLFVSSDGSKPLFAAPAVTAGIFAAKDATFAEHAGAPGRQITGVAIGTPTRPAETDTTKPAGSGLADPPPVVPTPVDPVAVDVGSSDDDIPYLPTPSPVEPVETTLGSARDPLPMITETTLVSTTTLPIPLALPIDSTAVVDAVTSLDAPLTLTVATSLPTLSVTAVVTVPSTLAPLVATTPLRILTASVGVGLSGPG
jgi:RNA polymerase sigma factor (sigma-70 family)